MSKQIEFNKSMESAKTSTDIFRIFLDVGSSKHLSGIKISEKQLEKIIKLEGLSYRALESIVDCGPRCLISVSDSLIKDLMAHPSLMVRILLVQNFELNDVNVLQMWKIQEEKFTGRCNEIKSSILNKYAKTLKEDAIQYIQSNGDIHDCVKLWVNGVGTPPTAWMLHIDGYHHHKSGWEGFNLWQAEYRIKCEAQALKRLAGVDAKKTENFCVL